LKNKKLVALAVDFVSFLLENIEIEKIDRIILFGSTARDEASEESDIDIFIDTKADIKSNVEKIKESFLRSKRFEDYWKLKGVDNDIRIITGELDKWTDLHSSIISNGITLYGKFEEMPKEYVHRTIFSWENVKPESRRVMLLRRLFGYTRYKKRYPGLLDKQGGRKIGKGIINVPTSKSRIYSDLFRDMKVTVKVKKVVEFK